MLDEKESSYSDANYKLILNKLVVLDKINIKKLQQNVLSYL